MLRHETHIRIATELATKKEYIIVQVRGGFVHCYGNVYHAKGYRARHQAAVKLPREAVSIQEVRFTKALLRRLLRQYLKELRGRGFDVVMSFTKSGELAYEATDGKSRLVVR